MDDFVARSHERKQVNVRPTRKRPVHGNGVVSSELCKKRHVLRTRKARRTRRGNF